MSSVAKISEAKASSGIVGPALEGLLKFIDERRHRGCSHEGSFEAFEREVRKRFSEAEREFLGEELARLDVTLPEVVIDGVRHRRGLGQRPRGDDHCATGHQKYAKVPTNSADEPNF